VVSNSQLAAQETIITNTRHYEALVKASEALSAVRTGIENKNASELIALDTKRALEFLEKFQEKLRTMNFRKYFFPLLYWKVNLHVVKLF